MALHFNRTVRVASLALASAVLLAVIIGSRAQAGDVDLDAVFRCQGPEPIDRKACLAAREVILMNCTVCHNFVPIVMQQFEPEGWDGLLDRHRPRVPQLAEAQIKLMRDYLAANFNPALEPPELPEELLKTWTNY